MSQVRDVLAETMRRVVEMVAGAQVQKVLSERLELTQHPCYKAAVHHYKTHCFHWHTMEVHAQDSRRLLRSPTLLSASLLRHPLSTPPV